MIRTGSLVFLTLAATAAGGFELAFPLDCTLGDTCFIQQFADRDPASGATDFTCGPLSYDSHDGTDIAVPTDAAMRAGVDVLAAAPGTVLGARDAMPDINPNDPAAPSIEGRECGNGVVIQHADGWQTQYCHMQQGSVAVAKGDAVQEGTVLGRVGQSGQAEFPHLHLSVRQGDAKIDPFDPDGTLTCGTQADPLWRDAIPYRAGGIIGLGFSTEVPEFDAIKAGLPTAATLPETAAAIVLWAHMFGSRAGDVVTLVITGPQGEVLRQDVPLDRTQARLFRAAGKRLPANGWPKGEYSGEVTLQRDGVALEQRAMALRID